MRSMRVLGPEQLIAAMAAPERSMSGTAKQVRPSSLSSLSMAQPRSRVSSSSANSASGSVIAFGVGRLNTAARAAVFNRPTPNAITEPEALFAELELTRERGWAIDNEESEEGLTCFAVPLIDRSGAAIAAISCSGPSTRMERNRAARLAGLRRAAADIAKSTG